MASNEFLTLSKELASFAASICLLKCLMFTWHQLTNKNQQNNSAFPPGKLTSRFLKKACEKYAAHKESQLDLKKYIKNFPLQQYSLHSVNTFAKFYIDDNNDLIKSLLTQDIRWEENLTGLMSQYVRKNSNVLDIGAHIGTHTLYFAQLLAGQGTVWSFEPQKKLFVELNANLAANQTRNVKTFRYAVGEKSGATEMNPPTQGNEGATSIGKGGDKTTLVTIDSLKIKNVSFIKIDVEGFEDEVINGASKTIQESKPAILVEIMCSDDRSLPHVKARIQQTIEKLKSLGYQTTRVSFSDYLALPIQ